MIHSSKFSYHGKSRNYANITHKSLIPAHREPYSALAHKTRNVCLAGYVDYWNRNSQLVGRFDTKAQILSIYRRL